MGLCLIRVSLQPQKSPVLMQRNTPRLQESPCLIGRLGPKSLQSNGEEAQLLTLIELLDRGEVG